MVVEVSAAVDPLSHKLGRIELALEMITKTLSEDRMASAQYRTDMRRDLTAVRDMVHELKTRVDNNADELADMRPDVEDYREMRAEGRGGWKVVTASAHAVRAAWLFLGAAGAALVTWIMKFGGSPPASPHP